jgi:hypothetical protein
MLYVLQVTLQLYIKVLCTYHTHVNIYVTCNIFLQSTIRKLIPATPLESETTSLNSVISIRNDIGDDQEHSNIGAHEHNFLFGWEASLWRRKVEGQSERPNTWQSSAISPSAVVGDNDNKTKYMKSPWNLNNNPIIGCHLTFNVISCIWFDYR